MTKNTAGPAQPPKPDLKAHYRPIGLKAVLAAALMVKRPVKKIA